MPRVNDVWRNLTGEAAGKAYDRYLVTGMSVLSSVVPCIAETATAKPRLLQSERPFQSVTRLYNDSLIIPNRYSRCFSVRP